MGKAAAGIRGTPTTRTAAARSPLRIDCGWRDNRSERYLAPLARGFTKDPNPRLAPGRPERGVCAALPPFGCPWVNESNRPPSCPTLRRQRMAGPGRIADLRAPLPHSSFWCEWQRRERLRMHREAAERVRSEGCGDGTSAASRPQAIRIRPMRGLLLRASKTNRSSSHCLTNRNNCWFRQI